MTGYTEDEIKREGRAVTVGSSSGRHGWVPLTVDEETSNPEGVCAGLALTPSEARALAALLLKHADRAEGREGPTSTPIPRHDCVTPGCTRAGGHVGACGIAYTFAKKERS